MYCAKPSHFWDLDSVRAAVKSLKEPVDGLVMKGMMRIMLLLGKVHKLEVGAKRFVDLLNHN
ncbi:hypothetical protein ND16A_2877 [Thalassotalea sp. ND16A]|nr:hypothetical protein ND16A_2877 [Thalassotalea sp. ND16A]